jgi:hypothetical protein
MAQASKPRLKLPKAASTSSGKALLPQRPDLTTSNF